MTRILASLLAAASFILPAAAFAQPSIDDLCGEARAYGEPGAMVICESIDQARRALGDASLGYEEARIDLDAAFTDERTVRLELHDAKGRYAAERTSANFYAVIALQVELNAVRVDIEEGISAVAGAESELYAAQDTLAMLEDELRMFTP